MRVQVRAQVSVSRSHHALEHLYRSMVIFKRPLGEVGFYMILH
jgi:hypothetical protein